MWTYLRDRIKKLAAFCTRLGKELTTTQVYRWEVDLQWHSTKTLAERLDKRLKKARIKELEDRDGSLRAEGRSGPSAFPAPESDQDQDC
jgi:hypothetical protein